MDLKHLLSLYIAQLEAEGSSSRDELASKNLDLSSELNRFFRYMDKARGQAPDATIDVPSSAEGQTALHSSSSPTARPSTAAEQHSPDATTAGPSEPARSKTIGNYKLLQKIAEGGMGAVWLAEQQRPVRRRVALKLIKAGKDTDQIIARFDAERQALAMMEHQNIAKMLDAGQTEEGLPFFVMELVQGIPITKYCDLNRLSLQDRLKLFIPVCHAVQHAHQKGIIHRDLKPSNVLVTLYDSVPVPKVIDFGLAKATQHQTRLTDKTMFTEFGQIVGTLQYMSPEQAELNSLDVDTRTDVYALGILLYELLIGSTPIEQSSLLNVSILKVLETIRTTDPPRPSARLSGSRDAIAGISQQRRIAPERLQGILKGDLDWVVMKALEKNRSRRYETASAFADDVQRYLNKEPLHARPPSTLYQIQKFVHKNRTAVIAASVMLGLLVLGLTGTTIGLARAMIAEKSERERSQQLQQRSEELEKITQFQQSQIRSIDAAEMGRGLRSAVMKEYLQRLTPESNRSTPTVPEAVEAEKVLRQINFTDVAIEALRKNIFLPAQTAIKKDYADQPLFQSKMLLTLSETMRAKGIFDTASIQECIALRERLLGPTADDTLDAKLELAQILSDQGKLTECRDLAKEILDEARRTRESHHPLVQTALGIYTRALKGLGSVQQAEDLLRENVLLLQRIYPPDSEEVLSSLAHLASTVQDHQKHAETEKLWRQILSAKLARYGEKSYEVYRAKLNLGKVLYELGDYKAAAALDEEVVAGLSELLGEMHPRTCLAWSSLAADYFALDNIDGSLKIYQKMLARLQETLGEDHPQTLHTASNTALCLKRVGQFAESESLYKATIEKQRRVLGERNQSLSNNMYDLGTLYSVNKQFDQAIPWLRQFVEATWDRPASCILIRSMLSAGKPSEAKDMAGTLRNHAADEMKDRPNDLAVYLGEMAQEFYLQMQYDAAMPLLTEAQKLFIQTNDRSSDAASDVETMIEFIEKQ